jgi:signal transduction histidine kinase
VHRMVEAHRGQIRVSSDAAKGTTVRVVLPTA